LLFLAEVPRRSVRRSTAELFVMRGTQFQTSGHNQLPRLKSLGFPHTRLPAGADQYLSGFFRSTSRGAAVADAVHTVSSMRAAARGSKQISA
jgi:hypothetical protein